MEVILNNEKISTNAQNLAQFMGEKFSDINGFAVAVGAKVIPRGEWESTLVYQDAVITIIRATRGG